MLALPEYILYNCKVRGWKNEKRWKRDGCTHTHTHTHTTLSKSVEVFHILDKNNKLRQGSYTNI